MQKTEPNQSIHIPTNASRSMTVKGEGAKFGEGLGYRNMKVLSDRRWWQLSVGMFGNTIIRDTICTCICMLRCLTFVHWLVLSRMAQDIKRRHHKGDGNIGKHRHIYGGGRPRLKMSEIRATLILLLLVYVRDVTGHALMQWPYKLMFCNSS